MIGTWIILLGSKVKGINDNKGGSTYSSMTMLRQLSYTAPSKRGAKRITNEKAVTRAIVKKRNMLILGNTQTPKRYANIAGA
jgi:hypothetical protein